MMAMISIGNSNRHKSFRTSFRFIQVTKYQSVFGIVLILTK